MDTISGSWNVEITTTQGSAIGLMTFFPNGSLIANEPPSPGETSGHGNWMSGGNESVAYTFIALIGERGGKLKVVGSLQHVASTNGWHGPFKIDIFDAGGTVTHSDTGTFTLSRIEIESLN